MWRLNSTIRIIIGMWEKVGWSLGLSFFVSFLVFFVLAVLGVLLLADVSLAGWFFFNFALVLACLAARFDLDVVGTSENAALYLRFLLLFAVGPFFSQTFGLSIAFFFRFAVIFGVLGFILRNWRSSSLSWLGLFLFSTFFGLAWVFVFAAVLFLLAAAFIPFLLLTLWCRFAIFFAAVDGHSFAGWFS